MEESAEIFLKVLEGKGTAQQNAAVIANSGMALFCADQGAGIAKAVERATESLVSGKAHGVFKKLLNID